MNCADVCLSMDWDIGNEFHAANNRRAAKPHRCVECGGVISVGAMHEYARGKSDGEFFTKRTCLVCAEVRDAFCCDGYIYGELWNRVCEGLFPYWEENMSGLECLARLTTDAAVAKMRAEYAEWRGEQDAERAATRTEGTDGR